MRFHHDTLVLYLKPYPKHFDAVVLHGGVGDYVQFDIYNEESLGYFLRSTHFGSYKCDYETGNCDDGDGQFPPDKIEVWLGDDGEVGVSGKATYDDVSMDNIFASGGSTSREKSRNRSRQLLWDSSVGS